MAKKALASILSKFKSEKRLKPKLNFIIDGKNLVIADNIAKLYSLNID